MRQVVRVGCVVASLIAVGCADRSGSAPVNETASASGVEASNGAASPVEIEAASDNGERTSATDTLDVAVEIKSWESVQEWVAGQQGKVVVIDVWSTSCHPCLREFPHFVELHEKHKDRVACASLSIDFYGGDGNTPQDVQPRVLKFLTRQRATMANFLSSDPDQTVLDAIGAAVIPVSLVYDREGKLHTAFNNDSNAYGPEGFNYTDDIEPLVKQLLNSAD